MASGVYTKIGRLCHFTLNVEWSGGHTGTGNTEITGLPYTSSNSPALYTGVTIIQNAGPIAGLGHSRVAFIFPNTSKVILRELDQATGQLKIAMLLLLLVHFMLQALT